MFANKGIQTFTESDKKILFYLITDGSKKEELAAFEEPKLHHNCLSKKVFVSALAFS